MIKYVYQVLHIDKKKHDDIKKINNYATLEEAKKVVEVYKTYKGFRDSPDTFFIQRYRIDEPHWNSGYATVIIPRGKQKNDTDNQ
ncbi:MAG: hypothetical protein AAF335_03885 [Bacteroidota bacterium]